jgi:hypothetical protein
MPAVNRVIDAAVFSGAPDHAMVEQVCSHDDVAQRTAAAGLRPPPFAVLIEGASCSVNAFRDLRDPRKANGEADNALMRLNFPVCAANG